MEIKLSGVNEAPLGIMHFKDGHEEVILYCIEYEDFLIREFHTVSGRYLHYNPGSLTQLIAYGYDIHGPGSNSITTKIKYCPMCGRRLINRK